MTEDEDDTSPLYDFTIPEDIIFRVEAYNPKDLPEINEAIIQRRPNARSLGIVSYEQEGWGLEDLIEQLIDLPIEPGIYVLPSITGRYIPSFNPEYEPDLHYNHKPLRLATIDEVELLYNEVTKE